MGRLAPIAAFAVLVVVSPARAQLLNPGPLAQAHADVEGDTQCSECHESGRGIRTQGCFRCHDDLGARVRAGRGLHGTEYRGRSCGECHVEHVGRATRLVRWPGGQEHFDHRLTGYALQGAHVPLECNRCHHDRNARGASTFLGASSECRSCHEDPHEGRLGTDCTSCHTQSEWGHARLERFDHARTRFALRGAHAEVQCARCHTGTPARYRGLSFGSCTNCHTDPHDGRFGAGCTDCHDESSWRHLGDDFRGHHPGLSLANGHASVSCETCHDAGRDHPPSEGSTCVSCHHNPHDAPLGRDCADCHGAIRWTGIGRRFGLRAHERVAEFPLRGRHAEADCDGCHHPGDRADQRFRQLTFDRCDRCHQDQHAGEFAARDGGECAGCHDERGFRPTTFSVASHALTAFALEGRHEAVPCSGCHQGQGEGSARRRVNFRVARSTCADCHANPHGEQFASEMADGGCAHCHEAAGWDRPHIDHSIFPLDGAHAEATCDACHTVTAADRAQLRGASYRGLPHECSGCHDDAHAAQFRLTEPVRACSECHDTASFSIASFDHAARTGWALEGLHADAPCAACHGDTTLRNGQHVTRYRLGYRRCADCHADPHSDEAAGRHASVPRAPARATDDEDPSDEPPPTPPTPPGDAPPSDAPAAPAPSAPPPEVSPAPPAEAPPAATRRRRHRRSRRSRSGGTP